MYEVLSLARPDDKNMSSPALRSTALGGADMTMFPLAANLAAARTGDCPRARTEDEATTLAGGPVFLAMEELPEVFATPDEADKAVPELYGTGLYELLWRDGVWRVAMRYWRPAPPAPVARTVEAATKKPLGRARTPEEARALLGHPAELARDTLNKLYSDHSQIMRRYGELVKTGLAEIVEREGKFALVVTFWRPMHAPGVAAPLAPVERTELAERVAAPLRADAPQAEMDVGLFERVSPENPDVVLVTDEGDGRFRGSE